MRTRKQLMAGVVLAAGISLTGILGSCTAQSSPSRASYASLSWRTVHVPAAFSLSPLLATAGDRLYMVGSTGQATLSEPVGQRPPSSFQVWSSADAANWSQRSSPPITYGFIPRALGNDGRGGLVVVGYVITPDGVIPQIWHSRDGSTFEAGHLPGPTLTPPSTEIVSVASGSGVLVAFGDHRDADGNQAVEAFLSTDPSSWTPVALPQPAGNAAIAIVAWAGGFAAVGNPLAGWEKTSVWTSTNGASWTRRADLNGPVSINSMVAIGDRLVLLGAKADSRLGMVPASWSTRDAVTWTESTAPESEPAMEFDVGTAVGGSIVAVGTNHLAVAASTSRPLQSLPAPSFHAWLSADGLSWRLLGDAPPFSFSTTSMTSFHGGPVVASGPGAVSVSIGDLGAPAGPSP